MRIRLDRRLELFFTVLLLSEYEIPGFCVYEEDEFAKLVRDKFGKFSTLPAVADFPKAWKTEIAWDSLPYYALALANDITMNPDIDMAPMKESIAPGENLSDFTASLNSFSLAAAFNDHFNWLNSYMDPYLQKLNDLICRRPVQQILEEYLGLEFPPTEVLLSTLMHPFMSVTLSGTGGEAVFCVCSRRGLDIAEKNDSLERILLSAIWHEFSHHVINPLTFGLFEDPDTLSDQQMDWCCAVNESIIWAINIRLLIQEKIIRDKDISWMVKNAEKNRAPQTRMIHELLCDYELNREKYPNISTFHPLLVEASGPLPI